MVFARFLRRLSWPIYLGFILLATLPFVLLFSASPWIFGCLYFLAALITFLVRLLTAPGPRRPPLAAAAILFAAGASLLVIDASGVLSPLVDPAGELILAVHVETSPIEVSRGHEIAYRLSVMNDQFREARQRRFDVDGGTMSGVLLYLELPRENGVCLEVVEARAWGGEGSPEPTIVYSESSVLLPVFWAWSTDHAATDRVVGVLSGDESGGFDLDPGASLTLEVTVRIPASYVGQTVRAERAVLLYEDPVPGAFAVRTLWFDPPAIRVID